MRIIMLRHGATPGNLQKRYIGTTDEPLSAQGAEEVLALRRELARSYPKGWPEDMRVVVSPLRRTKETARLVFGDEQALQVEPDLRECDFGDFENRNYLELGGNEAYQRWIDSGGTLPFPGGESTEGFQARCRSAFRRLIASWEPDQAAAGGEERAALAAPSLLVFVVHGGTIMSIASAFALDEAGQARPYFDWQLPNASGYIFEKCGSVKDDHFLRRTGGIGFGEETGAAG